MQAIAMRMIHDDKAMDSVVCIGTPRATLIGKRVLVVEDNGLLCCVLEQTLREAGCELIGPYSQLQTAIAATCDLEVDIALLDINIRGSLVLPLAERLQSRDVPVVLMSAYDRSQLPLQLQSHPHIRKPFSDSEMLARLADVLSTGEYGTNPLRA
jgi:CheY-like chemotaxis protein